MHRVFTEAEPSGHGPDKSKNYPKNLWEAALDQVDLIDLDVQGSELVVLRVATKQLCQKAKRVHIETHSHEIEAGLRTLFHNLGWQNVNDYLRGVNASSYRLIASGGVNASFT